jgi:hypothetical protein
VPVVSLLHRYSATCNHCDLGQPMNLEEADEIARLGGVPE